MLFIALSGLHSLVSSWCSIRFPLATSYCRIDVTRFTRTVTLETWLSEKERWTVRLPDRQALNVKLANLLKPKGPRRGAESSSEVPKESLRALMRRAPWAT